MRSERCANAALVEAALRARTWAQPAPIRPRYQQRAAKRRGGALLGLLAVTLLTACAIA